MDVRGADPRDQVWEEDRPTYRVYFWRPESQPDGVVRYSSDEYERSGAVDVHEAVAWATANAPTGATFTLYVVDRNKDGRVGLTRLAGIDPTASSA